MIVYGCGNCDGDRHNPDNLPVVLAGAGGGTLQTGRYLSFAGYTDDEPLPEYAGPPEIEGVISSETRPVESIRFNVPFTRFQTEIYHRWAGEPCPSFMQGSDKALFACMGLHIPPMIHYPCSNQ